MLVEITEWTVKGRTLPAAGIEARLQLKLVDACYRGYRVSVRSLHPGASLVSAGAREKVDVRVVGYGPELVQEGGRFDIDLLLETPFDVLERIERGRTTGEVRIELDLGLTTECYVAQKIRTDAFPPTRFDLAVVYRVPRPSVGRSDHTVARDAWLDLLRQLRFRDVLVVELPRAEIGQVPTEFGRAYESIEEARRSFDDQKYAHVCVDVCKALEHLAPENRGRVWEHLTAKFFEPGVMRDRVQAALIAIAPLLHLGRHAGQSEEERRTEVTREHAAFVLGVGNLVVGWLVATLR